MRQEEWKKIVRHLGRKLQRNKIWRKCRYLYKKIQRRGISRKWQGKNKLSVEMGVVFCMCFVLLGICLLLQNGEEKGGVAAAGKDPAGQEQQNMEDPAGKKDTPEDPRDQQYAVQPGQVPGTFEADDEKVVYLTFDDGPSKNTEKILDILDKYQVKATFFITGQQEAYRPMIKKAYEKGHTIGLHTYSHDYAKVYASVDAFFEDLWEVAEVAREQIGYVPCFIRFPGGASNTISAKYTAGIMTQLAAQVQEQGFQYYDWNAASGDGGVCTTEEIIKNSTSCSLNKIMLLCHDSGAKDTTVEGLPAVIEHYLNQGYVFKAIDRDSYVVHHGIQN